jgi:autotransporter-associated beta strand protein
MTKKYSNFLVLFLISIITLHSLHAQQDVFSRDNVTTGNFGDGQLPWFYAVSNNSQGDPDNGNTTRNFVKIGHNNNLTMVTNGRFYLVNTLDFQSAASLARTINNVGGGLSASGGIYNASSATHIFNTPIGIDGSTVQIHANSSGGIIFNDNIFINNNTLEFGNIGTGEITINGTMQGTGNVIKIGINTLTITGSHSYSGSTSVDSGVLKLQGNLNNSDVTVKSGATLEIDGNITVKSITVEAGGYVKVNSGNTLTLTNDLTLESTSDSYSSLISDGTITGTVNYNRHVNNAAGTGSSTAANDLISPPLSGMTFGDLRMANTNILSGTIGGAPPTFYLFGHFDNSSVSDYILYEETADDAIILDTGIGYRTGSTDGGTYTFTGGVETGTVTESISTPTEGSIWNLIGNPYPSYITLAEFLSINIGEFDGSSAGVYGYDGSASNGWTIWNGTTLFTNPDAVIAPGQGFFVASKSDGGSVAFNPNMRTNGTTDDFIELREPNAITNIKLNITTVSDNFSTDIYFTEFSTLGLDPGYDASLFGGSAPAFSIYSHLVEENTGIPFAIQALGETDYGNTTVTIGVNANQGEQLTFNLSTNTLPATVDVYLEDNVTNTSTLLNSNDYVLTPSVNLSGTGRFYLNFMDSALSTPENIYDDLTIYTNLTNKTIIVNGHLIDHTVANIYDIQGRLVAYKALNTDEASNTIDINVLQAGMYLVHLSNGNQIRTEKIIIN